MTAEGWSGPLPRPSDLEAYERIHTGLADRIVRMAEDAVQTSAQVEKVLAEGDVQTVKRGQWLSSAIAVLALVLAGVSILEGYTIGAVFVSVPVLQFASRLIRAVREPKSDAYE